MRLTFHTFAGADLTLNHKGYMQVRPLTRGGGSFFELWRLRRGRWRYREASDWLQTYIFDPVFTKFEALFTPPVSNYQAGSRHER